MNRETWDATAFNEWLTNQDRDVSHVTVINIRTMPGRLAIPATIDRFTNLRNFSIIDSNIETISENFYNLRQLESLTIIGCDLTSISDNIGNLVNLIYLNIRDNQLTTLPESIGNLTRLRILVISENHLTSLPDSIGNLIGLQMLSIQNNRITRLPESIVRIRNLYDFQYDRRTVRIPTGFMAPGVQIRPAQPINRENNNTNIDVTFEATGIRRAEVPALAYNTLAGRERCMQVHDAFTLIDTSRLKQFLISKGAESGTFATKDEFLTYLKATFMGFIDTLEGKEEAIRNFQVIYDRILTTISYPPKYMELLSLVLEFTKNQPVEFIQNYVTMYINDVIHAYNGRNGMSCPKGAMERIISSLLPATIIFRDTNTFTERGYDVLGNILTSIPLRDITSVFNAYAQECSEAHPEDVSAFRECIKTKAQEHLLNSYNNVAANEKLTELITSSMLYEGGRRRRTRKGRCVQRKAERQVQRKRTRKGRKMAARTRKGRRHHA